ncbi:MAG: response regulator [Blautia sp.]|nr:response regulator [Blautia sp.]
MQKQAISEKMVPAYQGDTMVKLFLVEDEIAMREGIRRHIHWEEEGIEFCGEAGDGELAWPLILEQRPDIVITDIKMPFMDGLQLSRLIRSELPETKIVILSGYTEFRYAQDALRIGVTEYLVKPITPKELKEVIRRLRNTVEEEKKNRQEHLDLMQEEEKEKEAHRRRKFFRSLISGEYSSHQLLSLAEETGLRLQAPYYQMLLLYIQYASDLNYQRLMENALDSLEEEITGCFLFEHSVDSRAILLSAKSAEELDKMREEICGRITYSSESSGSQPFFISTGRPVTHMSEIQVSWHEANRASSYRFFLPPNRMIGSDIPIHDLLQDRSLLLMQGKDTLPVQGKDTLLTEGKDPLFMQGKDQSLAKGKDPLLIYGKDPALIYAKDPLNNSVHIDAETALQNESLRNAWESFLRTGTLQEADDFMEDLFSSVGEDNTRSVMFLSYITMDGFFAMARFLKELGKDPSGINDVCGDINTVMANLKTAGDAKAYLTRYLKEVIQVRDSSSSRRGVQILKEAVDYIDEHFADEDMSLNAAAAAAGLSPNRFSALFSREMGMPFIEYLIGKRMDRAKELLMSTDLRSSEIAYQSGYKDPHYFSATFKKLQGMSPREYRMRGKGENE